MAVSVTRPLSEGWWRQDRLPHRVGVGDVSKLVFPGEGLRRSSSSSGEESMRWKEKSREGRRERAGAV